MSRERPGQKISRKLSDARRSKLGTQKQRLKDLIVIKTQAVAEAVAAKVRTEIREAVRNELDARGYLSQSKEAGTDEYPQCGMCNTLLDPDDLSYCPNTMCQRYPGPEYIEARGGDRPPGGPPDGVLEESDGQPDPQTQDPTSEEEA